MNRKCLHVDQSNTQSDMDGEVEVYENKPFKMTTPTSIQAFLSACGRKVKAVEPDGNCLFRAISHQLLGTEEEHLFIRGLLLRFENLNAELFQKYTVPGVTEANITTHVNKVSTPRVWGTHIEVVATATLFGKPVYFVRRTPSGGFRWDLVQPLLGQHLKIPVIPSTPSSQSEARDHIELDYLDNFHYDSIVSVETGQTCISRPPLHVLQDTTNTLIE